MEKRSIFDRGIRRSLFLLMVLVPLFFSFQLTTYTLPKIVIAQILVCTILALWFLRMTSEGRFSFNRSMLFFPIFIYFILSVFSLFSATSLPGGISLLWQIFAYILIYFIVINHLHEKEIETFVFVMSLVGILMSGYGILQYKGIEPLLKGFEYIPFVPYSTLGHPSQVAQYIILLIPLTGGFFFLSSSRIKRTVFGISTVIMIYLLFITKSRGGILGFLFSLLLFLSIGIYKWLKPFPFFQRWKWFILLFLIFLIPLFFISFPKTLTLKVKHINPIGYYLHSIDGSKIPANQPIRIEFDYHIINGNPQKPGYLNLYGEQTNSTPIYLPQDKKGWQHVKREDVSFSFTPYEQDIKLRWVPGSQDSTLQFKNIIVQTQDGVNLVKDPILNRLFWMLGVKEVDKVLSGQARLYMYRNTIEMIKHHFFFGVGFGNFKYVYPRYRDRGEWALSGLNTRVEQAHNEYLQIFSEVGIIGFLSFLWILWVVGRMSWSTIRQADSNRHFYINLILMIGIIATLVQSFFDFNLQNPASGVTFWMVIGFLEVIFNSVKEAQNQTEYSRPSFSLPSKKLRWFVGVGVLICFASGVFFTVRPVLGNYYLRWGRVFQGQEDWEKAILHYEKASVFSPNNFDVFFHLGQTSEQLKNYDRAVVSYKKTIDIHPYFIEARNNLGTVYIKLGMLDEAIEEFKISIEINPYHPGLHNNLGYLYNKRNLLKNAIEEYHKTLELDPENPEVHKNLGLLYFFKLRDYPKARQYWERYLVLNPEDPQNVAIKNKLEEIKKGIVKN